MKNTIEHALTNFLIVGFLSVVYFLLEGSLLEILPDKNNTKLFLRLGYLLLVATIWGVVTLIRKYLSYRKTSNPTHADLRKQSWKNHH